MSEPTTIPSLTALRGQRAAEEAHGAGRNKRDYMTALTNAYHAARGRVAEIHGVPVPPAKASIVDAIRAELTALARRRPCGPRWPRGSSGCRLRA